MDNQNRVSGDRISNSRAFQKAKDKAEAYAKDPSRLPALLEKAKKKAQKIRDERLITVWDSLMLLIRMLGAFVRKEYVDIPWKTLLLIIASIIYFVMPMDFIPDFILSLGFIDDAALLGWIIKSLKTDIDKFAEWEKANKDKTD